MRNKSFIKGSLPWIIIGGVFGLIWGSLLVFNININLINTFKYIGYVIFVLSVIFWFMSIFLIISCKKNINTKKIDYDKMEEEIDITISLSSISLILQFLAFGLIFYGMKIEIFNFKNIFNAIIYIVFIAICFSVSYIQYLCVEYNKKINPEKRGNAMDANFSKEWYASCDEAQKKLIGEVCYKTFMITNQIFSFMFLALIFIGTFINIGVFSILLIGLVNIINNVAFYVIAYNLEHRKK